MPIPETGAILKTLALNRSRFLYGLDCVPDDRLNWSPGGAARTPLQLADRVAQFLGRITGMLGQPGAAAGGGGAPQASAPPAASETREQAKAAVEASFEALITAVDALTAADLEVTVPAPWGAQL
ncbi:MAG TPA: DinB family protein, partial [Armatimonadota bacterium]|nr:DinB family protein [Armatimonadota bacterium]